MTRTVEWIEGTVTTTAGSAQGVTITKVETVQKHRKKTTVATRVIRHALKKAAGSAAGQKGAKK